MDLYKYLDGYYEFRKMTKPDGHQALLFLVSEVGELADAVVHGQAEWVRNTPGKERSVEDEVGDVMMMLAVTAMQMGLPDPVACMRKKLAGKGYGEVTE